MSYIDEMLKKLCPSGVEYKKVKDEYTRIRGTAITAGKMKEIANDEGNIRIFAGGKTVIDAFEKDIPNANITQVPAVLVQSRGIIDVVYYDKPFTFKNEMWAYTHEEQLSVKYLYYVLKINVPKFQNAASGMGSMPQISLPVTEELEIPVPPLEVQREIVQILDKFTLLTAELTAELTARKKQYDYYGNQLFEKISDDVNVTTVGEVITSLKTGLNPRKNFTLNEQGACYPYITGKDIYDNKINVSEKTDMITPKALELINKRAHLEKGLLLFASTGTGTVGRMAIIEDYDNDWGMSETLYGIKVDDSVILPHYLMFYLYSVAARNQFEPKITKGSVPHLKVKDLLDVKIPVPTIEEQQRIVDVLSRFDKLCNGMIEGLPAEIDARQKQYEYYRDKLLTFDKAV